MEQKTYKLRPGSRFQAGAKVNINAMGERLAEITARNGGNIQAAAVVADGQDVQSPFYTLIEHDPEKGLEQWNLQQARNIINSVLVTVTVVNPDKPAEPPKEVTTREYVENPTPGGTGYEPLQVVLADPIKRESLLARAWKELQAWEREYRTLEELADIFIVTANLAPIIAEKLSQAREAGESSPSRYSL